MYNISNKKGFIVIVGGLLALVLVIVIPAVIISNNEKDYTNKEQFPGFTDLDLEEEFDDEEQYEYVLDQLGKDPYFVRTVLFDDFDYIYFSTVDIKNMVRAFVYNYENRNSKYFSYTKSENNVGCLQKKYVVQGFYELFSVDMTPHLEFMTQFFEHVYESKGRYCFYFDSVVNENEIKVGVEKLSVMGDEVSTDIYVYEYYSNGFDEEKQIVSRLEAAIDNKQYEEARRITEKELNGNVYKKEMKVRIQRNAKFFKYQVLYSKKLDY
ncbi:MAG: hypothetical protein IJ966_06300 [Bacilli bacterium]|nr:hypothetical protein [Bacilli bacterium]